MSKKASRIQAANSSSAFDMAKPPSMVLVSVLLFVVAVCVFMPSIRGGFLYYDENAFILNNSHVNEGLSWANFRWAFHSVENANWYPLTWLSHMLDVQVYGVHAWGHHLTNILFHAFNAVLVFLVFGKLTGNYRRSLVLAGLFALHPLRVESVAWVSERKDVLSTMFWFASMWAYLKFVEASKSGRPTAKSHYLLAVLFFVMGLMSKTMLVTLPFVFLLLDFWPLERFRRMKWSKLVLEKIPFFLLTIAVSAIEYLAQRKAGAFNELSHLSLIDRVENAFVSYPRYIGKFLWPEHLCVLYPHPGHWPFILVAASVAFVIGVSVFIWRQRRISPYLFVGWFWFVGTFIPVINLVQLGSQSIADRYTYIPMIGFAFVLVWGIGELTRDLRFRVYILPTVVAVVFVFCTVVTRYEIQFWRDDLVLWNRALAVSKDNYAAHNCLGLLLRDSRKNEAFLHFQEAVRINPDYADAQRNLAGRLFEQGRFDEAIPHYQRSLELDPICAWAEFGLGLALYQTGRLDDHLIHLQKGVEYDPNNAERHYIFALALYEKRQSDQALDQFRKAVALAPDGAKYQTALGAALLETRQLDPAIECFQKALRIKPGYPDAQKNLETAIQLKEQARPVNNP